MHRFTQLYLTEAYSLPNRVVRLDGTCGGIELSNGRNCCIEFGEDLLYGGVAVTEVNICGCPFDDDYTWTTLDTVYIRTPRRGAGLRFHTLLGQIAEALKADEEAYRRREEEEEEHYWGRQRREMENAESNY